MRIAEAGGDQSCCLEIGACEENGVCACSVCVCARVCVCVCVCVCEISFCKVRAKPSMRARPVRIALRKETNS